MTEPYSDKNSYRYLTDHALRALREDGWEISKAPGHGRSNVWRITRGKESGLVSIRTTKERWIAYQPQDDGKKWKTLDSADYVCISAVSFSGGTKNMNGVDVHLIDAKSVRESFDAAYKARTDDGHTVTNDFGMWVCMDAYEGDNKANRVGSGIATEENRIARYRQYEFDSGMPPPPPPPPPEHATTSQNMSVATILERARADIALATGIPFEAISLELNLKS